MKEDFILKERSNKISLASPDLAERIIKAAAYMDQKQSLSKWLRRIFKEFSFPAPIYSLTSLLCIGFLTGFLTSGVDSATSFSQSIVPLLYESEGWYE